ncbi:unnamed protein product [Calypogeia fissa]
MAGTERSPTGRGGRSGTPPPLISSSPPGRPTLRTSTSTSMEATLDLLTGLDTPPPPPPSNMSTNPFLQSSSSSPPSSSSSPLAAIDPIGDRPQTTPLTSPSPSLFPTMIRGGGSPLGAAEANPIAFHNLMYSSNEPLDLLTGLFPPLHSSSPSSSTSAPSLSPTTPGPNLQDVWGSGDLLGQHSLFSSGGGNVVSSNSNSVSVGIELFGAPDMEMASNNPFLGVDNNAVRSPSNAYSPTPPTPPPPAHSPVSSHHRGGDVVAVPGASGEATNRIRRAETVDQTPFAKFPPPTMDHSTVAHFGRRSSYSGPSGVSSNSGTTMARVSRSQSVSNGASIMNMNSTTGSSGGANFPSSQVSNSSKSEFSSGSGFGDRFERIQGSNGPLRADSSSSGSLPPSPPSENLRKSTSESRYDNWMQSEVGTSSSSSSGRVTEKESRTIVTSPRGDNEYVGAPGKGMYKPPTRGAVHPRRPVSMELRPHPLRGAPANQVTLLTCLEGSVWAVCELGLMVWDIKNSTGPGSSAKGNNPGDEDAAEYEFLRVQGSTALCITADVANQVVWTGHRDGKVRCWPGRAVPSGIREARSASLPFQALRHAVTAILFTPYGELWAGSESGELRAWPWNAVAKALTGVGDCASLMEKSYYNLSIGIVGATPNGPTISPEVRFLIGDHAHGRVWCAGSQYTVIWDAKTRERVKMFLGPNVLDVNTTDTGSPGREIMLDEALKLGYAKVSNKKDKGGWLQRSRNAVMGAADAVRRAATTVTQGFEEDRKLEALVAAADGTIWGGYGNGSLAQWDWEGYRMRDVLSRPVGVKSLCVVGNRLWVGYNDGKLNVLAGDTGKIVGSWLAHRLAVISMAVSGGYMFSLGLSGSIRGWNISSPNRDLDEFMKAAMTNRADKYTRKEQLQVLVGTWNTAQEKASLQSTKLWLAPAADASIVAVGLQEVEMGAGAIGMAAVKESVGMGMEKGSATGSWWLSHIDNVLGEEKEFERLGSRQLAGMLIGVWVRRKLLPYVGDVEVGAVACGGLGRTLGNKGAVGVRLNIFRRTICVLTSHLAAHMEHISKRNADFEHIYNQMAFSRITRSNSPNATAGVSNAVQNLLRGGSLPRRVSMTSDQSFIEREEPIALDLNTIDEDAGLPELADADLLIWTGDLNYRIDLSYEEVISLIKKEQLDTLLLKDQLRYEMANGRTFQGLREGAIRFSPTYKFDKWTSFYDTSEKKRIPAWCDRVLFRDSFGSANDSTDSSKQGLGRPCKASVVKYEACMEPEDSDHKPVRCILSVDLAVMDEADRRYQYGYIMHHDPQIQTRLNLSGFIPETSISTNRLVLQDNAPSILRLSNGDRLHRVVYMIQFEVAPSRGPCPCGYHSNLERTSGEDQYPRAGFGFPPWLQVLPAAGLLEPSDSISISVKMGIRLEERGKSQQDDVCVLVVNVKGVFSSECKQHRICVTRVSSSQGFAKEKEAPRRRLQDRDQRPSSASSSDSDSQGYGSRSGQGSSSFTRNTPDLLL